MLNFFSHVNELRWRLIYASIAFLSAFICSYLNITVVIYLFTLPFLKISKKSIFESDFIFTNIFEAFSSYIYICLIVSLCAAIPFFIYITFSFFKVGLLNHEKKQLISFIRFFLIWSSISIILVYEIFLPFIFKFFLSFQNTEQTMFFTLKLEARIINYVIQMSTFLLFGIIFCQIPNLLMYLLKKNMITAHFLKTNRRMTFICCLIIGCLLSPPDIYSQLCVALPLFICIEVTLFFAYIKINLNKKEGSSKW